MEISSQKFLPVTPGKQSARRTDTSTFRQQENSKAEGNREEKASTPRQEVIPRSPQPELDYRQLVLRSRSQQFNNGQNNAEQVDAYRVGGESHRVQQALGAYRDTQSIQQDEHSELMPRLDNYV